MGFDAFQTGAILLEKEIKKQRLLSAVSLFWFGTCFSFKARILLWAHYKNKRSDPPMVDVGKTESFLAREGYKFSTPYRHEAVAVKSDPKITQPWPHLGAIFMHSLSFLLVL